MTADQGVKLTPAWTDAEKERAGRIMDIAFDPRASVPEREVRIAAEIRSASEAARKEALEEVVRWHEAQGDMAEEAARHYYTIPAGQSAYEAALSRAAAHHDAKRHHRELSSRGPEREGRRE